MNNLSEDLKSFWQKGKLGDVEIVAGETTFFAHKAILAARSTVFVEQFESEEELDVCDEKNKHAKSKLVLKIEPKVCEQMLQYIYCGSVDLLDDFAVKLLPVAHKVNLFTLKVKMIKYNNFIFKV